MANVTVGPKAGGDWQVTGESRDFKTQAEGVRAGRRRLRSPGGGELVVIGRDGRIRMQSTIGRSDPRRSSG